MLIRDKNTDDYILKATELMQADIEKRNQNKQKKKKAEPLDMSLPGKWHDDDPNTHARAKEPYHEILDMKAAENDIDIHAKMLDMVNSFMEQVQTNTNKQNEYIHELENRLKTHITTLYPHDDSEGMMNINERVAELEEDVTGFRNEMPEIYNRLEKRIAELESFVNDIDHTDPIEDPVTTLRHRIDELENRMNMCNEDIQGLDNKIDSQVEILDRNIKALWQIFTGHKNEIRNGGALKALHTLLGELI